MYFLNVFCYIRNIVFPKYVRHARNLALDIGQIVGGLIPTRDESNEGGVIRKPYNLDSLVTGGVAVVVQRA